VGFSITNEEDLAEGTAAQAFLVFVLGEGSLYLFAIEFGIEHLKIMKITKIKYSIALIAVINLQGGLSEGIRQWGIVRGDGWDSIDRCDS
jgi:hypothetical protein